MPTVNNCGLWNTGYWFSNLHQFSYWENIRNKINHKTTHFDNLEKGIEKNENNYPRRQQSWPSQTPAVPRPNNCHLWHWGDEGEGTLHTTPINEKEQQQTLAGASYNQSMCCFTGCELVSKLPVEVYSPLLLHFLIQPFFIWITHFQAEPSSSPAEPLVAGYFRALNISARISCRPQLRKDIIATWNSHLALLQHTKWVKLNRLQGLCRYYT